MDAGYLPPAWLKSFDNSFDHPKIGPAQAELGYHLSICDALIYGIIGECTRMDFVLRNQDVYMA